MIKIEYSPAAKNDLKLIPKDVKDSYGDKVAEEVLYTITAQIRRIELFPVSGASLSESIQTNTTYRYLYVGKHYIFCRVEKDHIKNHQNFHVRQDFIRHLSTDQEGKLK